MKSAIWPAMILTAGLTVQAFAQKLAWSWSNPQPHGNDIVGMAWNGSLGVQVCELGQVYTSTNLVDWTPQNSNLTNDLQAVTFFGKRIIITGANGTIAYSDDGVNFTNCSVSTANWLVSVAASSNVVVAVGDSGALYTSTNGAVWQLQPIPSGDTGGDQWLTGVAYGNGVFVITGDTGGGTSSYIANSSDGIHWTNQVPYNVGLLNNVLGNLEAVAWINTTGSITNYPYTGFWAVDDAGNSICSTNNGYTWKQFLMFNSTNVLYTVAADKTTGLLVGDSEVRLGFYFAASNHVIWPEQTGQALTTVPPWTYFAAVSQTNGVYELAGYDGMLVQSIVTNGNYNWFTPYSSPRDWLWQITVANGLYVAVGDNGRIMTSDDGADWNIEAFTATNSVPVANNNVLFCVGGNSNLLVAAGNQGSLVVSPNLTVSVLITNIVGSVTNVTTNSISSYGTLWYALSAPAGTTNDLAGVCTFSNKFYLVGGNGTILTLNFTNWAKLNMNNLNLSLGGNNWTKVSSPTTNYLSGIAVFTNGLVVSGDQGNILTSPDGASWTKRATGTTNWLFRVRCVNGRLLSVGENGALLTSTNSVNWVTNANVFSGTTNWLNDAVMTANTCYVVGNNGLVLASTNFVNWTNVPTLTTRSLYAAATQNGQLIVAGLQGTILQAQLVPYITYAQTDGYNVFLVDGGGLSQKFTLDSSTNLLNWLTGPMLTNDFDGSLLFYQAVPTNTPAQFYRCTVVP